MTYLENPRKVYGKVKITYSDKDISKELKVEVSNSAAISHKHEVVEGYSEPTIKACTMDSNSIMNGSFQMMDDSVILGWWSGVNSNREGVFSTPPSIELFFILRPIITWKIMGDVKLGEYPVDFVIEYKNGNDVIKRDEIIGNSSVFIELTPKITDITSVKMSVKKWSSPYGCAKILQFYDSLSETYEGDALENFEVTEEMGTEDGFNINSDTLVVSIYNENRKFDKGYLKTLMVLDRKVEPSIGIEENGEIKWTALGTFYSDEWQINQDSQWVKCSCVDRLYRLQDKNYIGYPITSNASLYDILVHIFRSIDLSSEEYFISEGLKNIVVDTAYIPKTNVWDAFQEIANVGLCRIYVDRDNKIVATTEEDGKKVSDIEINNSNSFTYVSNITLTEFANSILVDYTNVSIGDDLIDVVTSEVSLEPFEELSISLKFSSEAAYPQVVIDNANIRLSNIEMGVDYCNLTLTNITNFVQSGVISIEGNAIEKSSTTINLQDEESIKNFGVVDYTHTASDLIQTSLQANSIARRLLDRLKSGQGVITSSWRGTPKLTLGSVYRCKDRFGDVLELECEYNKFTYNGGLKQETRGRKIKEE